MPQTERINIIRRVEANAEKVEQGEPGVNISWRFNHKSLWIGWDIKIYGSIKQTEVGMTTRRWTDGSGTLSRDVTVDSPGLQQSLIASSTLLLINFFAVWFLSWKFT